MLIDWLINSYLLHSPRASAKKIGRKALIPNKMNSRSLRQMTQARVIKTIENQLFASNQSPDILPCIIFVANNPVGDQARLPAGDQTRPSAINQKTHP